MYKRIFGPVAHSTARACTLAIPMIASVGKPPGLAVGIVGLSRLVRWTSTGRRKEGDTMDRR